jgi:hypothetical protein
VAAQAPAATVFRARTDAVRAIERAQSAVQSPEIRAELALHWAEAIERAASVIPAWKASGAEPYASWIRDHAEHIVYDEPGGRWMLRAEAVLNLHQQYQATAAADDLAWRMVTAGLPGECEGFVPCYVERVNLSVGRYLELHPKGIHTDSARTSIERTLKTLLEAPSIRRVFDRAEQCADSEKAFSRLADIISTTRPYKYQDLLALLDRLREWCR